MNAIRLANLNQSTLITAQMSHKTIISDDDISDSKS